MSRDGRHLFTSESVTEGHPDKIADQISDSVLDAILAQDAKSRVACETLVTTGLVVMAGEITTNAIVDFQEVARAAIRDVGYTRAKYGFDADTCAVLSSIHKQSPDISMGVDTGGAGDQGLMFGYACNETEELMPLPIMLAHKLVKGLSCARRDGVLDYLRPDGKSQVTVEYEGRKPVRVDAVVISSQHREDVTNEQMRADFIEKIINRVVPAPLMDKNTKIYVNPTGRFVVGGPHGDAGLTGRKIIVDTYGGAAPHGGGSVLGQRSHEGGPIRLLHGALHRQELRGGRLRGEAAGAAGLCHRRGRSGLGDGGDVRNRQIADGEDHRARSRALQAHAEGHHRRSRSAEADLQEDRGVRALRAVRRRLYLGEDRPRRRASQGRGTVGESRSSVLTVRKLRLILMAAAVLAAAFLFVLLPLPPSALVFADPPSSTAIGSFHVHTNRSDGSGTPDEVAAAAARAGLNFIVLTDHGDGTREPEPPQYRSGVLVIDGVELSTQTGHYIALGLPRTPYPLRGEARDVVEDVRRLGGFGVVAHADSAKPALRWHDWNVPFDAMEWLNADTEWRDEGRGHLLRALARYPFRPAETLASLLDRPEITLQRWDALTQTRPVVALAGADAHARAGWLDDDANGYTRRMVSPHTVVRRVVPHLRDAHPARAAARHGRTRRRSANHVRTSGRPRVHGDRCDRRTGGARVQRDAGQRSSRGRTHRAEPSCCARTDASCRNMRRPR